MTLDEKRVARMLKDAAELLDLQRVLYEADQIRRCAKQRFGPEANAAWLTITNSRSKVDQMAFSLANSIQCYFKTTEDPHDSIPH